MATGARRVPVVLGSGATGTEEGRAFFVGRLSLFGGWVFLVSFGFFVVGTVVRTAYDVAFSPAATFHLLATFIAGGIWLAGRTVRPSASVAHLIDWVGTFLICASFAAMARALAIEHVTLVIDPMHGMFVALLACSYVLISRSIALPSTATRTIWIGVVSIAPLVAVNVILFDDFEAIQGARPYGFLIDIVAWCVAAVAMSAVASRVIFGLRAEVSKIRRLGQYALEEKIGEGGMGVVYRARHAMLRRPTAIKLLQPAKAGEKNLQRFEREVQLTAGLSHPSTVAIFDYGRTPDGLFYYAMEYLDGIDLQRLIREDGPQAPGRVVHILEQVCGALAEAHDVGLIHRDVKPANVILCERGGLPDVAKVVDFGLVKRIDTGDTKTTLDVTSANMFVGTPLYLAPEAITRASSVDGRSDLYALGAVGYFLLTGTPVFQGKTVVEVCADHLHTEPEPPSKRKGEELPAALEQLILQCLAKSPADRPADARVLQRALAACKAELPWTADEATRWWTAFRQSHVTAVAAVTSPAGALETAEVDLGDRLPMWH